METQLKSRITPGLGALIEVGILFLPAIPAYLWVWPVVSGQTKEIFQIIVYIYVLAGTLFIGLRRWKPAQLGLNLKGIWLSLVCAAAILAGRLMIILAVQMSGPPPHYSPLALLGQILYLFGLVGLVEELLFRGLVYHALEEWLSPRWAIWGSAFGFMLWHIFGHGVVAGVGTFFIGLAFALIRQRAGGILGLIVLHALWDLESALLVSDANSENAANLQQVNLPHPVLAWVGFILMLAVPLYLWLFYGRIAKKM